MIFHNEALVKITNIKSTKNLNDFIEKPAFKNQQLSSLISLKKVAQNRLSKDFLSEEFKLTLDLKPSADGIDAEE